MKASPGARSWMAAGVRHELLTRALPALRHEMAAPVSVIRMSALLLKRQMSGAAAGDASAWAERVALIEEQVAALALGVHALRDWELSTDDEGITRGNLVARCTALMRVAFELRGIRIHVGEGLSPAEGERRFPAGAALRYMFLGALGYLHDSAPNIAEIRVEAEGEDALRFSARHGESTPTDPLADAHRAPRALAIDAIALQSLAEGLGYSLSVEPDSVCFALGTALAPA
jgi:hypothetical protein